ncbi:MAG: DUF4258 domain-containing protein [Deltaproteobacteria bacterium]|nr:DUF4258 domain-containing protein [Deltaproteobacteria bacterium]
MVDTDILQFIKLCVKQRKILWTHHVNMRLKDRFIARNTLLSSVGSYEIIEEYAQDKYLPSYLVFAKHNDDVLHIQVAVDRDNENIRIVTAYKPTLYKWEEGFRKRRSK